MSRKSLVLGIIGIAAAAALVGGSVFVLVEPETYQTVPQIKSVPSTQAAEPPATQSRVAPSTPQIRHDPVAQAMPTHLTIWRDGESPLLSPAADESPNIDSKAATMNANGEVLPSTLQLPAVQNDPNLGWAVLPGTGVGTTVIVCHTKADSNPPLPCNALTSIPPDSGAESGYRAELKLPTGTLVSELTKVHPIPKAGTKDWAPLFTKEPDRWFVVMCELERDPVTGLLKNTYISRFLEFHLVESVSSG